MNEFQVVIPTFKSSYLLGFEIHLSNSRLGGPSFDVGRLRWYVVAVLELDFPV